MILEADIQRGGGPSTLRPLSEIRCGFRPSHTGHSSCTRSADEAGRNIRRLAARSACIVSRGEFRDKLERSEPLHNTNRYGVADGHSCLAQAGRALDELLKAC